MSNNKSNSHATVLRPPTSDLRPPTSALRPPTSATSRPPDPPPTPEQTFPASLRIVTKPFVGGPSVRDCLAGCPLWVPAAPTQPDVHRDRGALARHRDRREYDDLLDRERGVAPSSAGPGRTRPSRRYRAHRRGPEQLRHVHVSELPRHTRARHAALRRLCGADRAPAGQPQRRQGSRADLRRSRQRELFPRARHHAGARPAADRRRRPAGGAGGRGHQLRAVAAPLRPSRRHGRPHRDVQQQPGDDRRDRAAALPGDHGDARATRGCR